ncbi:hypothetical protein AC249_AIPGENE5275, partial [Exaiptasia diaphana]
MAASSSGNNKRKLETQSNLLPAEKRPCLGELECIIHCSSENSTELRSLKDIESWQSLLKAASIRNHKPLLDIAETLKEGEIPDIKYHKTCRSLFTMKKDLDRIFKNQPKQENADYEDAKDGISQRSSIRQK